MVTAPMVGSEVSGVFRVLNTLVPHEWFVGRPVSTRTAFWELRYVQVAAVEDHMTIAVLHNAFLTRSKVYYYSNT